MNKNVLIAFAVVFALILGSSMTYMIFPRIETETITKTETETETKIVEVEKPVYINRTEIVYVDRNTTYYIDRNQTVYVDRPIIEYVYLNQTEYIPIFINQTVDSKPKVIFMIPIGTITNLVNFTLYLLEVGSGTTVYSYNCVPYGDFLLSGMLMNLGSQTAYNLKLHVILNLPTVLPEYKDMWYWSSYDIDILEKLEGEMILTWQTWLNLSAYRIITQPISAMYPYDYVNQWGRPLHFYLSLSYTETP